MKYKVTLRNKVYEVEVEHGEAILLDEYEAVAPAAPVAAAPVAAAPAPAAAPAAPAAAPAAPAVPAATAAGEQVTSPMPGTILDVRVNAGDSVKAGQVMMILEAMKMENEIVAPRDAVVAQVVVNKGAKVETGSPLIVLG